MADRKKSCEGRIDEELKYRIAEFRKAIEAEYPYKDDGYEYEDFIEWINSNSLALGDDPHYRAKKLELSWGGPQDYFLFFEDETIEYHFLDWFDGAKRELEGQDYKVMAEVKDSLGV